MKQRPGHKQSIVMAAGIIIRPIPIGSPGVICKEFRIKITKINKQGVEIETKASKASFKKYPVKGTKEEPGIWEKVAGFYDYYYNKITTNKQ